MPAHSTHALRPASAGRLRRGLGRTAASLAGGAIVAAGMLATGTSAQAASGWDEVAACESGGNPQTNTGNGFYGKFQFTLQTWASVGGSGNPASASEAEQNQRAEMLYAREGASPWPVCGR